MGTLFISLLTLVLLLISAFVVLLVLMQRTSQSGGMGAALGGGAAESAFGADTNNMLTKGTIYGIIAFFLVSLGLYLLYQAKAADRAPEVDVNTLITGEETAAESTNVVVEEATEQGEGTLEPAMGSNEDAAESSGAAADEAAESETAPSP
jgi:preprotein translocase subunit SecG